jgi:glycosyltransferase involved in cell wall biosynthesis
LKEVYYLNQGGGRSFRDFVRLAATIAPSTYLGPDESLPESGVRCLKLPRHSNRGILTRLLQWLGFLALAGWKSISEPGKPLLFIVTNPPLSPFLGFVAKKIRGQQYILLFYDLYPDALIRFAGFSRDSFVVKIWNALNRSAIQQADRVVAISPQMASRLFRYYDSEERFNEHLSVIPTWVDTDFIRPLPKEENWFARKHNQVNKLTVLYAGNIGTVHDLTLLPDVADRLRSHGDIHFLIIGEGVGRKALEERIGYLKLQNVTLLPLQEEAILPYSLSTGDIGIVSLADGSEGISMPSKTYYTMAAGSALLGISSPDSDLAKVIQEHDCGVNITPGDVETAVGAILQMRDNPLLLRKCRENGRRAAESHYSKNRCAPRLVKVVEDVLNEKKSLSKMSETIH